MGTAKVNNIDVIYIGSEWILISYGIYETSCVFYIPEPLARGYKIRNEFRKYRMKFKFHVRFFLSHVKLTKTQEKYSFIEFYY